jgi:heme a synthase
VLDWPLLAALLHTGGAAALAVLLAVLLARAYARPPAASREPAPSRAVYENHLAT